MKIKINKVMEDDSIETHGYIDIDMNEFGHELCMGIRHGLYGSNCDKNSNLLDSMDDIAIALNNISNSIDKLSDTLAHVNTDNVAMALGEIADNISYIDNKENKNEKTN